MAFDGVVFGGLLVHSNILLSLSFVNRVLRNGFGLENQRQWLLLETYLLIEEAGIFAGSPLYRASLPTTERVLSVY